MAIGDKSQQGITAEAANKFPVGMRVLAVDDNLVSLKVIEALLRHCKYYVTTVRDGDSAVQMLLEGREQYDLVISDVHMPDMDGFGLLEIISLNMDIPVIMLSANGEEESVMRGICSGACDYLVKPVNIKELKNIWQHVVRRRIPVPKVQPVEIVEGEGGDTQRTHKKKCSRRRMKSVVADENKKNICLSTKKKLRVTWTRELHGMFLQAVNKIGVDRAVPKKIMEIMNVNYITRDSVASHLQKYRTYLKKVSNYTETRRSYSFANSSERWNSCHGMNDPRSYNHHYEYGSSSSSGNMFPRMNSPSAFGAHGMQLPTQAFHLRKLQSNMGMGPVIPGGSMLRDARKLLPFGHHTNSFTNIPDDTRLDDDDDELPTCYYGNSYTNVLHNKIFEASKGIPGDFLEDMPSDTSASVPVKKLLAQSAMTSVPVNQLQVHSPQLVNNHLIHMNCTLPMNDSHFQDIVGNHSRSWQNMVPTEFPDLGHNGGVSASLGTSQVDIHKINRIAIFPASSDQIPTLQNQVASVNNNTTPLVCLNEPTLPFGIEDNTNSIDILDENLEFGGASSISSALHGLEIDNFLAPTPRLSNEGAVGSLDVLHEVIADQHSPIDQLDHSNQVLGAQHDFNNQALNDQLQVLDGQLNLCNQALDGQRNFNDQVLDSQLNFSNQAPDDEMNHNNHLLAGTNELDVSDWDEILANFQNENFEQDDTFMDGDWN